MSQQHTSQGYDVQGLIEEMGEESIQRTRALLFVPRLFQISAILAFVVFSIFALVGFPEPLTDYEREHTMNGRIISVAFAFIMACVVYWVGRNAYRRQKAIIELVESHRTS